MPKIVDWDARRDEILSATWRVIARDGIARATIRSIAREAGCSRGILAHYFDDKADILGSALVMSHRRVVARMEARSARRCAGCSTRSSIASPNGCAGISSRRKRTASSATAWTSSWPPTSCSS